MEKKISRQKALALAFFLGFTGIHRFYVGKKTTGGIQLAFTIGCFLLNPSTNILMIIPLWQLSDTIRILFKKFGVDWEARLS